MIVNVQLRADKEFEIKKQYDKVYKDQEYEPEKIYYTNKDGITLRYEVLSEKDRTVSLVGIGERENAKFADIVSLQPRIEFEDKNKKDSMFVWIVANKYEVIAHPVYFKHRNYVVNDSIVTDTIRIDSVIYKNNDRKKAYKVMCIKHFCDTTCKCISVPNGVRYIANGAFSYCINLKHISLPNTIQYVGSSVFEYCVNLDTIDFPSTYFADGGAGILESSPYFSDKDNELLYLGNKIHYYKGDINDVVSLHIKNGTKYMDRGEFEDFVNLKSVIMPTSLTELAIDGFKNCHSLEQVELSDSLKIIPEGLFENCKTLKTIKLPDGLQKIGAYAFNGCLALDSIFIPNSVIAISGGAFHTTAWYANKPDGMVYINKVLYDHKGVLYGNCADTIKNGTQKICDWAFSSQPNLVALRLPKSIIEIGNYVFRASPKFRKIIMFGDKPPKIKRFTFNNNRISVYVPDKSMEVYKSHEYWGKMDIKPMSELSKGKIE